MIERLAESLGMDSDDLKLVIAMLRKVLPKFMGKDAKTRRDEHLTYIVKACSPHADGALGRAGLVLWDRAFKAAGEPYEQTVILRFKGAIGLEQEDTLRRAIIRTWEEYS